MKKVIIASLVSVLPIVVSAIEADWTFGGDARVRQEIFDNVPMLPKVSGKTKQDKTRNMFRFRPRLWTELKLRDTSFADQIRLYLRLNNEWRYGITQKNAVYSQSWPGSIVIDNLYLEFKSLFSSPFDLLVGRRDIAKLYGLDHIFMDGTAGDGSRSCFGDIAQLTYHVDEDSTLDFFAMMCRDKEWGRFGTARWRDGVALTGLGGNEIEMDDWAFGAIWSSRLDFVKYQLFGIQKNTAAYHDKNLYKHPRRQVNLFGVKLVPQFTENFSTPMEAMVQVGRNSNHEDLCAWSTYVGFDWKNNSCKTWRPFWRGGLHILSGDKNTAEQSGGRNAWDPMWYRAVDDSEMLLYGGLYGCGWWSNMINLKTTLGIEIDKYHAVSLMCGPMFTHRQDHLGGGNGRFKGFLTQVRYDFPLFPTFFGFKIAEKSDVDFFGHILLEWFNPGDYYASDAPAFFVRWQVEMKF